MNTFRIISGVLFGVMLSLPTSAQLADDFSDGDFINDPVWEGSSNDFLVNESNQLQLDAVEPGESTLFTQVSYPDSVRWSGYALFDFAPSNNNNGAIYLAIDNQDLTLANGYILRLGENGSDDAIRFVRLDEGSETLLATGTLGAVGLDPAKFNYQITREGNGNWIGVFGYNNNFPIEEFTLNETTHQMSSLKYFGVEAKVTSSNVDNIFFDDFIIEEDLPDTQAPSVVSVSIVNSQTIEILFDELMNEASLTQPENYFLSPGGILPSDITLEPNNPFGATLVYEPPLLGSTQYSLMISGCVDLVGNVIEDAFRDFLIPESPVIGDLHVSEILFDPYIDQDDFVEIYNSSDKVISLNGVYIENQDKNERDFLDSQMIMLPQSYLAVSTDTASLKIEYDVPSEANFAQQDIPSFNNSDGNFSIGHNDGGNDVVFESFDYQEDFHYSLIDDTEGVSLGRLSYITEANSQDNWISGTANTQYATPGYANSGSINLSSELDDFVQLESKVFSPNGDGDTEFLTLLYGLDKEGYLASVQIYDYRNQLVSQLANNQLIASEDFMLWDGLFDDGTKAPIGPYILYISVFHPDGEVKNKKLVAILADFLD